MAIYVNLYSLNEGEQAEAYKRRKEEEKRREERTSTHQEHIRSKKYGAGYNIPKGSSVYDKIDHAVSARSGNGGYPSTVKDKHAENYDRSNKSHIEVDGTNLDGEVIDKAKYEKFYKDKNDDNFERSRAANRAADALDRHKRRHPEQYKEMGIFAECYFFNEDKE